jgi:trans-aconitate methyltransferase
MMTMQQWNPQRYAKNARFVSDLGEPVIQLLSPKPGERVLDLGCGDGVLTEKLIDAGCIVVAVDDSPEQVAAAQARGLDARVGKAESLSFSGEFDAVFSNAALHWVKAQDAALSGVFCALKPGGRFVGELGGAGNVRAIRSALNESLVSRGVDPVSLDPWFFPTVVQYEELLIHQGFAVESIRLFSRPTLLPGDISGWLDTFAQPFLAALPTSSHHSVIDEVREVLRPALHDPDRGWIADYVRLRFAARKRSA